MTLELDTAARTVARPRDLSSALTKAGAREAYRSMSFSHQREDVDWVTNAKRPETRERRVGQVVADALARSRAARAR